MVSNRTGRAVLLAIAGVFLLLRFVHLTADYPQNIRWDDGIGTDEGWYASAAVDRQTWGVWRLPGDMNIPVLMPVWSGIADAAFHVFGFSVTTLRATAVCFFLLCVVELCLLLRFFGARDSIPLFVLMLAVNPWGFAFSRSGFLEFPMLSLCLLAMLLCLHGGARVLARVIGAGVVFGVALLLKSTGIALLPPVIYLLFQQRGFSRRAWRDVVAFCVAFAVVVAAYWVCVVRRFPDDVRFYLSVVQDTFHYTGMRLIADASRPFRYGLGSDHALFVLMLVVLPLSLLLPRMRKLWREPLFALAGVWLICFLGFMVKHNNDPARYFALTIPAVLIVAVVLLRDKSWAGAGLRKALLVIVALDVAVNAAQVTFAMTHARYTFHDASVAIGQIVRADARHSQVVIGDEVHEVVLQNGLRPVNLLYHSADATELMRRYQPGWWVEYDHEDSGRCFAEVLSRAYTADKRGEWDVLKPGMHLTLWRLDPIAGAQLPQVLSAAERKACLPPF